MATWLKTMWQLLHYKELMARAEVDRIASLQQSAKRRRAEYAEEKERVARMEKAPLPSPLPVSRKRVEEAEAAYATALQAWDNKEFRRRPR